MQNDDYLKGIRNIENILARIEKHTENGTGPKEMKEGGATNDMTGAKLVNPRSNKNNCSKCGTEIVADALDSNVKLLCPNCKSADLVGDAAACNQALSLSVGPFQPVIERKPAMETREGAAQYSEESLAPGLIPTKGSGEKSRAGDAFKKVGVIVLFLFSTSMVVYQFGPVHKRVDGRRWVCMYDNVFYKEDLHISYVPRMRAGDFVELLIGICDDHQEIAVNEIQRETEKIERMVAKVPFMRGGEAEVEASILYKGEMAKLEELEKKNRLVLAQDEKRNSAISELKSLIGHRYEAAKLKEREILVSKCDTRLEKFQSALDLDRNFLFTYRSLGSRAQQRVRQDAIDQRYRECKESCSLKGVNCLAEAKRLPQKQCKVGYGYSQSCLEDWAEVLDRVRD